VNTPRIPNIVAIGESPRLLEAIGHAARQCYAGVEVMTLQPQMVGAGPDAAWLLMRPPYIAFLEWETGMESLLPLMRPSAPHPPMPVWLLVRPGESPGLDGTHVSGSLLVHADMPLLQERLSTLMDFLKICIYP
jgi:hypothetical protein